MKVVFRCQRNNPISESRHEVQFFPVRPERDDHDHPNRELWGQDTVPVGSLNLVIPKEKAAEIEVGEEVELEVGA